MNKQFEEIIEINPPGDVKGVVIWMHGLGADGHDFEPLAQQWDLTQRKGIRFVFPNAPIQSVTINNGMQMRAWYDIYEKDIEAGEDSEGIKASQLLVNNLINQERERNQLGAESIVLAGFSQGGVMALHTGLRYPEKLAGILGLSCYLPLAQSLTSEKHKAQNATVLRMDHGNQDPVVPLMLAQRSREALIKEGYKVEFNRYDMAHSLCPEQIPGLYAWLVDRFK